MSSIRRKSGFKPQFFCLSFLVIFCILFVNMHLLCNKYFLPDLKKYSWNYTKTENKVYKNAQKWQKSFLFMSVFLKIRKTIMRLKRRILRPAPHVLSVGGKTPLANVDFWRILCYNITCCKPNCVLYSVRGVTVL